MELVDFAEFAVCDTETTGFEPPNDRIVEVSVIRIGVEDKQFTSLVNPMRLIPMGAQEVHHISDEMVKDAPSIYDLAPKLREFIGDAIIVAHFAQFDKKFLDVLELPNPWLCTCRLARHLWPDAPGHSNQALREFRHLQVDTKGEAAHRAGADTLVTAALLREEVMEFKLRYPDWNAQDLLKYAASPVAYTKMPFGKHKGLPLDKVPYGYVSWLLKNMKDMDDDLRNSLENSLATR